MTILTDFLGQGLQVGDEIVAMERYSSGSSTTNKRLVKRVIKRFTPKMVVYEIPFLRRTQERKLFPQDCVRIV